MRCQILLVVLANCAWLCTGQLDQEQILRNSEKARRLPQVDVCGRSIQQYGTRIINGRPAVLGSYPWMAAIGYLRLDSSETWACGGSLITDQYVITAAHCLSKQTIRPFRLGNKVRLGDLDLDDSKVDGASPIDVGIESWKIHEQYNGVRKINDIGLIKLDRKIAFTDLMRPICLPTQDLAQNEYVNYTPVIAGWGRSINESRVSTDTRLLEGEVTIRDREGCRQNNTAVLRNVLIDQRVLCASAPRVDSCQGDSGGPLMWQASHKNARPGTPSNTYLMGIVSYGYGCAVPNYPGVYTRVAMYMQWIIENLDI